MMEMFGLGQYVRIYTYCHFTHITSYYYKLKSICVIHNCVWLHLFGIFTLELHVIAVHSYTARDNNQTYCIECTWRKGFTNSSAINNVQRKVLKYLHIPFPGLCYYGVVDFLITCVIMTLIKFGMQPVFIMDFMSIFFANILTQKSATYTSC